MRKVYNKPEMHLQEVQLGVFGNYGDDDTGGGTKPPKPTGIVNGFPLHMD